VARPHPPGNLGESMLRRAVTCTLDANKALLDRPARTDGGLPRARLYVARCGGDWVQAGKIADKIDVQHAW
jgi:hypothetical protein